MSLMILFFAAVLQFLESDFQPHEYHTWMYVVWITTATVGYGDITPKTTLGKCVSIQYSGIKLLNSIILKKNECSNLFNVRVCTSTGRIADMMFIAFAVVSVPKMTNELFEKMKLQSVYARAAYIPKVPC